MSAAVAVSHIQVSIEKVGRLVKQMTAVHPTNTQFQALETLGSRLSEVAAEFSHVINNLRDTHEKQIRQESAEYLSYAKSINKYLEASGQLKNPVTFRRNIVLIFQGPRISTFDSDEGRSRKASTRKRCEQIRALSPDHVIIWASTFAPNVWGQGSMGKEVFDHLLKNFEPESVQAWPAGVSDMLRGLATEEPLQGSHEYREFLKGPSRSMQIHQQSNAVIRLG